MAKTPTVTNSLVDSVSEIAITDAELDNILRHASDNLNLEPEQLWRYLAEFNIEGLREGAISFENLPD